MAAPDPLVTAEDVANEPDIDLAASDISDRMLQRAARTVNRRLPNETDEWLLGELQLLVTAHFAHPGTTKGGAGRTVSSVRQGNSQVSFENEGEIAENAPGGYFTPYWAQAVELDHRMDRDKPFDSHTL